MVCWHLKFPEKVIVCKGKYVAFKLKWHIKHIHVPSISHCKATAINSYFNMFW